MLQKDGYTNIFLKETIHIHGNFFFFGLLSNLKLRMKVHLLIFLFLFLIRGSKKFGDYV